MIPLFAVYAAEYLINQGLVRWDHMIYCTYCYYDNSLNYYITKTPTSEDYASTNMLSTDGMYVQYMLVLCISVVCEENFLHIIKPGAYEGSFQWLISS